MTRKTPRRCKFTYPTRCFAVYNIFEPFGFLDIAVPFDTPFTTDAHDIDTVGIDLDNLDDLRSRRLPRRLHRPRAPEGYEDRRRSSAGDRRAGKDETTGRGCVGASGCFWWPLLAPRISSRAARRRRACCSDATFHVGDEGSRSTC